MIAGALRLNRQEIKALKIIDDYSLHRVIYSLFADTRTAEQKQSHLPSGFLYVDKGGDFHGRHILFVSDREPQITNIGELQTRPIPEQFLHYATYRFEVIINPTKRDKNTGKTLPIKGRQQIASWFLAKSIASWGFSVEAESLQVGHLDVKQFGGKNGHSLTMASARLQGLLQVLDREKFIGSFKRGIGRGRAFGFGLLQIVPVSSSNDV